MSVGARARERRREEPRFRARRTSTLDAARAGVYTPVQLWIHTGTGMSAVSVRAVRARKLLLLAVVGALCLTAAIAVVVLLIGHFDDTSWRILATTSAISFFGLLAVPAGMLLEQGRAVLLARASGALTAATFVLTLVVVWRHWSDGVGKTWGVLLTLAAAAAQAAAVEARRRESDTPAIAG